MSKLKKMDKKIVFALGLGLLIIIGFILIIIAGYFKDYGKMSLTKNKEMIFSIDDLKLNDLKYGSSEEEVIKELGKPKEEKLESKNNYNYKTLKYNGLTVTLKEDYSDFILVKVEVTSKKYIIARNIKVGKRITYVFDSFKVDNSIGAYIYGNYTNKALNDKEITGNIYYGVRTSENVLYVNRDKVVENLPTNIAKLNIEYSRGKIYRITWSYDVE